MMRNLYQLENTMTDHDYENLGRYHAALDAARELMTERHNTAGELERTLKGAYISSTPDTFATFDHVKCVDLANKLAELNVRATKAVEDVNQYAAKVGKSKIHTFK